MRVFNLFAPVFTRHETRNQIHRAGTVQSVERNQIFEPCGFGIAQHALHPAAFKLEHRFRFTFGKQAVHLWVIEWQVLKGKVLLTGVACANEFPRDF